MKPMGKVLMMLALCVPDVCLAEIITRTLEAEVRSVTVTNGPTDVQGFLQPGHLLAFTIEYNTEAPGSINGNTGRYFLSGLQVEFGGGANAVASFGSIVVTNDHPSWDSIQFIGDPTNMFGGIAGSRMLGATLLLSDASRDALSSPALDSLPPFSAFSSGEFVLSFTDLYSETVGTTRVQGRIVSTDSNPLPPAFRCHGFGAPFQAPIVQLRGPPRVLALRAALVDETDQPVGSANLLRRPIVRVLKLTGELQYAGLDGQDASFVFRHGAWRYNLRGLGGPGTYVVSMVSPDQREYAIDMPCSATIEVAPR